VPINPTANETFVDTALGVRNSIPYFIALGGSQLQNEQLRRDIQR